jgi:hypothetical protein
MVLLNDQVATASRGLPASHFNGEIESKAGKSTMY